jgi:hypothetical protein
MGCLIPMLGLSWWIGKSQHQQGTKLESPELEFFELARRQPTKERAKHGNASMGV